LLTGVGGLPAWREGYPWSLFDHIVWSHSSSSSKTESLVFSSSLTSPAAACLLLAIRNERWEVSVAVSLSPSISTPKFPSTTSTSIELLEKVLLARYGFLCLRVSCCWQDHSCRSELSSISGRKSFMLSSTSTKHAASDRRPLPTLFRNGDFWKRSVFPPAPALLTFPDESLLDRLTTLLSSICVTLSRTMRIASLCSTWCWVETYDVSHF